MLLLAEDAEGGFCRHCPPRVREVLSLPAPIGGCIPHTVVQNQRASMSPRSHASIRRLLSKCNQVWSAKFPANMHCDLLPVPSAICEIHCESVMPELARSCGMVARRAKVSQMGSLGGSQSCTYREHPTPSHVMRWDADSRLFRGEAYGRISDHAGFQIFQNGSWSATVFR